FQVELIARLGDLELIQRSLAASPPSELDSPSMRYTVPTGRGIHRERRNTASTIYAQLWIATGHNFEQEERRCRRKSFYERTET
ncbi:hypothetical protein K0M31_004990, partial [Melipona bicolor]